MNEQAFTFDDIDPKLKAEAAELVTELYQFDLRQRQVATDRMFAVLMVLQWLGGIATALMVSPRTWIGQTSQVHLHVWAAVLLGAALSSVPIALAIWLPGRALTRHVIAIAQMLWSALLIHLSGGRIETHFHVFGSLAFLAFYRDWRVLVTATVVIAADHFVRGIWWPQSVFGVFVESPYRWIEHAAWVVFEDIFLILSCRREIASAKRLHEQQASLRLVKQHIERLVHLRTQQLEEANEQLQQEMAERQRQSQQREQLYARLVETSRRAGMAEVATGVLHNVGNVLNSINVSAHLLVEQLQNSRVKGLQQAMQLLAQHKDDLAEFLTRDEKGQQLLRYLEMVTENLTADRDRALSELDELMRRVEHVKEIVNMQQNYAKLSGGRERFRLQDVLEDAVRINDAGLLRHGVDLERDYRADPWIVAEKHKVLQILINLISNAKYAVSAAAREDKRIVLRIDCAGDEAIVAVEDNGVGIAAENLARVFEHGFTTKKDGHGFGLHYSALAADDLGGSLSARSDGPGHGATFILRLPIHADEEALCLK